MKQSPLLAALANDLCHALPAHETDLRLYISDLAMYHHCELMHDQLSEKPNPMPYYGKEFAAALEAVERGWEGRVVYHTEFLAKAVKRAGGVLVEVNQ